MLIGLDIEASRVRAVAIDETGMVIARASVDCPPTQARGAWLEQDPIEWWLAAQRALRRVSASVEGGITGLGLSGLANGTVFLNEGYKSVRPALLGPEPWAAIGWLRDVEPVQHRHLRFVISPKDYVGLMLTGELLTDTSQASTTGLLDLEHRGWSTEILSALGIPTEWLPRVEESRAVCGLLRAAVADLAGLPAGLPVAAGAVQSSAIAIGAGSVASGLITTAIGGGGMLLAPSGRLVSDPMGRLSALCHAGHYGLTTGAPNASNAIAWWRSVLGGQRSDAELAELASSAPPGADGLYFLPNLDGPRGPRAASPPRGAFVGLRTNHTSAHLTRAVFEGVLFNLRTSLEAVRALGLAVDEVRATGIFARHRVWRRMLASILEVPVRSGTSEVGGAYGAALLGGVAAGTFADVSAAAGRAVHSAEALQPSSDLVTRYRAVYDTFNRVRPALQPNEPIRLGR